MEKGQDKERTGTHTITSIIISAPITDITKVTGPHKPGTVPFVSSLPLSSFNEEKCKKKKDVGPSIRKIFNNGKYCQNYCIVKQIISVSQREGCSFYINRTRRLNLANICDAGEE